LIDGVLLSRTRCFLHSRAALQWTITKFQIANGQQRCGKELFDDFKELRPGAAEDLASTLRRMHSGPQSNPNRQHSGLQCLGQAVRQQISGRRSSWLSTPKSSFPIHNRSETSNSNTNVASLPNSKRLFLLSCIGYGRYRTRLSQQQLDDVRTDRQLFFLMRGQYLSKHWWRRLQSFRTLIGLDFVQVNQSPAPMQAALRPSSLNFALEISSTSGNAMTFHPKIEVTSTGIDPYHQRSYLQ